MMDYGIRSKIHLMEQIQHMSNLRSTLKMIFQFQRIILSKLIIIIIYIIHITEIFQINHQKLLIAELLVI